jgi:hypothetical protein
MNQKYSIIEDHTGYHGNWLQPHLPLSARMSNTLPISSYINVAGRGFAYVKCQTEKGWGRSQIQQQKKKISLFFFHIFVP